MLEISGILETMKSPRRTKNLPIKPVVMHFKGFCYGHGYQNARKQVGFQFGNDIAEKTGFLLPVFNGLAQFSDLGFFHFDLILTF